MAKSFWASEVQVAEVNKSTTQNSVFRVKATAMANGQKYADLREYPSFKGVAIPVGDLPAVIKALQEVVDKYS